jgi:hypothetical protein
MIADKSAMPLVQIFPTLVLRQLLNPAWMCASRPQQLVRAIRAPLAIRHSISISYHHEPFQT